MEGRRIQAPGLGATRVKANGPAWAPGRWPSGPVAAGPGPAQFPVLAYKKAFNLIGGAWQTRRRRPAFNACAASVNVPSFVSHFDVNAGLQTVCCGARKTHVTIFLTRRRELT